MTRRGRDRQGGYILVAVLAVAVVLTGLVAAGSVLVRSTLNTARVEDADIAAGDLLTSATEIVAFQLAVLKVRPESVDGRRIRLTGGVVTPHVTDEAGKVDLNAADPKLLAGVLGGVGMDDATVRSVVDRIVELRGPTNGVIPDGGGPGAAAPPRAANGPANASGAGQLPGGAATAPGSEPRKRRGWQSVEELADMEGVTREDMRLLRDRLTIYNPDGRLNVTSASPEVLGSIPGVTKLQVTQLVAARASGSPQTVRSAQSALGGDVASFTKATPGPAYTLRIDADETSGRRRSADVVIAASKSPNEPFYILDWRE